MAYKDTRNNTNSDIIFSAIDPVNLRYRNTADQPRGMYPHDIHGDDMETHEIPQTIFSSRLSS